MADDVRNLIAPTLPAVSDLDLAWEAIQEQVARRRRRRRLFVGAVTVTGAAVVVAVLVGLITGPRETSLPPAVGPTTSATPTPSDSVAVLPDCVDASVPDAVRQFVADWTTGQRMDVADHPDLCLLQGQPGPTPTFDTARLGQELPLAPGDTAGQLEPPLVPVRAGELEGYPVVHLGRVGDTDRHAMLGWWLNPRRTGVMLCLENDCHSESLVPPHGLTVQGAGGNSRSMVLTAWVPADAAAVGVSVEGQPQVWQRPVARTVQIRFDPTPGEVDFDNPQQPADSVTVTAYNADGEVLDQATTPLP